MKSVQKQMLAVLVGLGVVGLSFYAGHRQASNDPLYKQALTNAVAIKKHPLIAQRVFTIPENDTIVNFEPLRAKLRTAVEGYGADSVSLYFEYLPTGTSIRIGDTTRLVGASLLKLPIVMDLYHLEEKQELSLDTEVSLKKEWLDTEYGDLYKKGEGYRLTIRELVRLTLEDSDNTAISGLRDLVMSHKLPASESSTNALDVDLSRASADNSQLALTARAYSSFMKCLYFSCFLNATHSQEILDYLSHGEVENDRLPKYLPSDVTIAHKIGSYYNETQGDCGIVYVPNHNYVFCMLVNDTDDNGSEAIAKVSKDVYDYISRL